MPTKLTRDEIYLLDYALRLAQHDTPDWADRQEQALFEGNKLHETNPGRARGAAKRSAELLRKDQMERIEALTRKLDQMLVELDEPR
jgi:hypothetical protein